MQHVHLAQCYPNRVNTMPELADSLVMVNVGGGPRPFAPWGQAELKSALPPVITVRVGAAPFSNDWRKPVGAR